MFGAYTDGLEQGEWMNYWDNGTVKNSAYFKSGELNGEWKSYSPEYVLLIDGEYKNGLKYGEWKLYNSAGRLLLLENFKIVKSNKNSSEIVVIGRKQPISVLHGKFEAYSEVDFTVKATGMYKNGKKNGTFIDYYPGGVVPTIVAQYKNGKLNGLFQQFSRQGGIRHQIQYKEGLKNGSFLIFNSSGQVVVRKDFSNGIEMRK
jgi:antitoxin component YwqK of YwqJK toxin-antitoxin module